MKRKVKAKMTNEFLELGPKQYTYKIVGSACTSRELRCIIGALNLVEGVVPTSIKTFGIMSNDCKFKFKGTEEALKLLISELSTKLDFKVRKVRRVWF